MSEDSSVFLLLSGKVGLPWSNETEKAEGRVGFGSKSRRSDLGMLYLKCLFYVQVHNKSGTCE